MRLRGGCGITQGCDDLWDLWILLMVTFHKNEGRNIIIKHSYSVCVCLKSLKTKIENRSCWEFAGVK